MHGWFSIGKSIHVIENVSRNKDKSNMIISIDAEKALDKTKYSVLVKAQLKLGIEGMCLNIIKAVYIKPTDKLILNGENLKPFPLKSGMRHGYPLSPLLFNMLLEFLARAIKQEEEIKGIQIGKEEVKLSQFADDMIFYLKDPENSTKKLLTNINTFMKSSKIQNQYMKISNFLYANRWRNNLGK
jgi:hypothetical protein